MYVIAVNRIRAAYVDIDPGIRPYFLAGVHDDRLGTAQTYSFLRPRNASHLTGSPMILIGVVVSCVCGLLAGAIAAVSGASTTWVLVIGVIAGALYLGGMTIYGNRIYTSTWRTHRPLRPTGSENSEPH